MKINPSMYNISSNNIKVNDKSTNINYNNNPNNNKFSDVLQKNIIKNRDIIFSKHANMRLQSRNINLSNNHLNRINKGIEEANKKGIRESLIIIDNVALVVNIKNKTVVTAIEKSENDNKVFTNIDGAVIV
ncbi:MAG: flagellar biosynthesis protein [Vallitalea sp.]|jgi:flagellar operon protein|nr:flagellar biosynthesis protein [Vallitalea sp.]